MPATACPSNGLQIPDVREQSGLSASETPRHTPHGPSLTVRTRTLTGIAGLPAHRRQVALVRWSLIAVPDRTEGRATW